MGIRERGYEHWKGTLQEVRHPWWPITRLGIRLAFRKKGFRFIFAGAFIPAVVTLAMVYISERLDDFQKMVKASGPVRLWEVDPNFFKNYFSNDGLLFLMIMILVFAGAGLIADDLKYNSLQLYLSRPLKKKHYIFGKSAVILFFLLLLTFVPGLIFIIFKTIFSGSFQFIRTYPWLILSVIGYSLFISIFFTMYTLLLSSLSRNSRYVSILIFGVYIFSQMLFGIFFERFHDPALSLLSIRNNLQQVAAFFFNAKYEFSVPVGYSILVLAAIIVAAALILRKRVKEVDIIK